MRPLALIAAVACLGLSLVAGAADARSGPATGRFSVPAPLRLNAMWIWQLPKAQGGDVAAIGARAKAAGFGAVYVKSADAGNVWAQFTP
ncbi:MAG: hypothetical protein F2796_02120, partial [Actinobacteria bacterium]|nr:hypothetical protein [Actinomycetota bacterium]